MKNFKLVIPSEVEVPQTLRITLPEHDNIAVEVCFESAKNNRIVEIELGPTAPTRLHGPDDRTTELLSQMDIESSGGFIPPDIASQLDEDDGDEIVDASQCEEEEQPDSVIPGLYSPPRTESREHKMDSSFEDDCFVPATQQRKHEKIDTDDDDDVEAVIVSSDEDGEEEANPDLTAVARTEKASSPAAKRRSSLEESSPPKFIDIDEKPEERPRPAVEVHDLTKERDEDSEDSFAGVPMPPDSQPVEPIVRKKFIKKKNKVVLSSDDEEDEAPGEVNRSLPDFETEPSAIPVEEEKTVCAVSVVDNPTLDAQQNLPVEEVKESSHESLIEETDPRNAEVSTDRNTNTEAFDEDAEILTGVQIVEDSQAQSPGKPDVLQPNQDLSEEKMEISETEDQHTTMEFKAPKTVDSHSPLDRPTQESLRLSLHSESEKAEAHSKAQTTNAVTIPASTNEEDYVYLRDFQLYPTNETRRCRVAKWLENLDPVPNSDYVKELEEEFRGITVVVSPISREDSPVIETANDTVVEENSREAGAHEAEPSNRKRSFPGPCIRSPEKRHRNNRSPSANQESPPKASSARTPDLKTTKVLPPQLEAGDDKEPRGNCEDDEVPELVPIGSPSHSNRKNLRRRKLYHSDEETSQPVSKIVDSQEIEKFALPSAVRTSERTPSRQAAQKSVRTSQPGSKGNLAPESTTRSTRRTPARQKDLPGTDIGIEAFVRALIDDCSPGPRSKAARLPTPQRQTSGTRNSKGKAPKSPQDEVLVAETVPDERSIGKLSTDAVEVEETPAQEASALSSTESLTTRRKLRSRKTIGSESSKTDLPDPYAKETIEVDPPAATRTRSSSKKSESSDPPSAMVEFSEEINPELVESRPLRSRQGFTGPNVRASRVRSVSNIVEREQSVPKRSRLIRKSSSSITVSARTGRENRRKSGDKQMEDPNSSIHSIGSSDSSIGVNRWAKARVMFTGIDNPPRQEVIKLGLKLTEIMSQCNVVVAAKFTRTVKMMYAMAKGVPVVSSDWVLESFKARKVLGIENFMLRDPVAEKNFNFKLENTLRLASETKFFKGWSFYVTKSCAPNAEQLGEILGGCDAKVVAKIPMKFADNTAIVSCAADRKLLPKKPPVPVVSVEFVFHGILHHQLDFETFEVK